MKHQSQLELLPNKAELLWDLDKSRFVATVIYPRILKYQEVSAEIDELQENHVAESTTFDPYYDQIRPLYDIQHEETVDDDLLNNLGEIYDLSN